MAGRGQPKIEHARERIRWPWTEMVHSRVLSLQRGEVTSRWRLEKRALLREGTTERSQEWSEGPSPSPRSASKPKQTSLARCVFHLRLGTRRLEALTTLSLSPRGSPSTPGSPSPSPLRRFQSEYLRTQLEFRTLFPISIVSLLLSVKRSIVLSSFCGCEQE